MEFTTFLDFSGILRNVNSGPDLGGDFGKSDSFGENKRVFSMFY